MNKIPQAFLKENIEAMQDKKQELLKFIDSLAGEVMTQYMEDTIMAKRNEFLQWLDKHSLNYLLDCTKVKTGFEYVCFTDILNIFHLLDGYIEQHDKLFGKPIGGLNKSLCRKMCYFSSEYEKELDTIELNY